MKYNIGLIRVLSTEDTTLLNMHGELLEKYFPNFNVESRCIPDQYYGIHDDKTEEKSIPKIVALAKEFADKDAIIISCCGDPALEEVLKISKIPVIAGGSSVAFLSQKQVGKVGVLGITEVIPAPYSAILGDKMLDLGVPEGVNCTLDLMSTTGRSACLKKGVELKAAGATSIALACTGFSTVNLAAELERHLGIPVLDPVVCEGIMTYFELLRRSYTKSALKSI